MPWNHAVVPSDEILAVPPSVLHDACGPTQIGSSVQPCAFTLLIHDAVRFGCAHARLEPPM